MTPERLALVLGLKENTLYKAWKSNGLNGWAIGSPLRQVDIDTIVLYYASIGNETAKRLAEGARKRAESAAHDSGMVRIGAEPVTETDAERPETSRKPSRWYYLADGIFFAVVGVTGYELAYFLGAWGLMLWAIYAAAISISLVMAKDMAIPRTAQWGFTAVIIFEALAYFGHLAMANLLVVNAAKRGELPFDYSGWGTLQAPFWIAAILAGVLSGVVIYVVWLRLEITKELNKKALENG